MKLSNSEMSLMKIIWEMSPIKSGTLVLEAFSRLGWKKSTVYTVVKKLSLKGAIKNENAVITPLCTMDEALAQKSEELIERNYNGYLPTFLTAFLKKEKLTRQEAEELKSLIDSYIEEE